jgi:iron complex transport system ATP-binding protein
MSMSHANPVDALKAIFKVCGVDLCVGATQVCHQLNLEIYPGETLAVLGKNGVGKSTLLSCLAGLPRGDMSGEVLLGGKTYDAWGAKAAACWRGWLPQKQQDQFSATVLETVISGRHPHLNRWTWESADDYAMALAAIDAVGMADFVDRDVLTLSGGERQRVAVATILTQQPTLYFMDEPLAHLDLNHQIEILDLVCQKARRERVSAVMVLHEPGLAYRYCDSALLLFGEGDWLYGSASTVLTADNLSRLYGYPLVQIERPGVDGKSQRWFVPA